MITGFRTVVAIENATSGTLDTQGNVKTVDVTNNGAVATRFYPNDFPNQGHPAVVGILIYAGQTRTIPMTVFNFKADAPVDVVGYGM